MEWKADDWSTTRSRALHDQTSSLSDSNDKEPALISNDVIEFQISDLVIEFQTSCPMIS